MKDQQQQLVADMDCLREELTNIELVLGQAQGEEFRQLRLNQLELRATLATKGWALAELQLRAEGLLPVLGSSLYLHDKTDPDYWIKAYMRGATVVAYEMIAASSRAGGFFQMVAFPPYPLTAPTVVTRAQFENVLDQIFHDMEWDNPLQWRFTDYSTTPEQSSSTLEYRKYLYRTNPKHNDGCHRADDVRVEKLRVRPRLRQPFTQCRVCGCTNLDCRQCVRATGIACHWVAPYLCSRCYDEQQAGKEASNG